MLEFFDCDLGVGRSGLGLPAAGTPAAAQALMDRYDIRNAVVYDRGAMESGRFDGFEDILAFCAGSDRLLPTISAAPPACGESPSPAELVDRIRSCGIKAVRLWPKHYGYLPDPFTFGKLFERLEPHRIPVIVHLAEEHAWTRRPFWREVRETARAFKYGRRGKR